MVRFRSQLLPAGKFVELLVVVPFGRVEVTGQAVRVQVVVAFGFGELVQGLETVQTDHALSGREIAVSQVFAHHVNQIEYDWGAHVLVQLRIDAPGNGVQDGVAESTGILQFKRGPCNRVARHEADDDSGADISVRVVGNEWENGCLDGFGYSAGEKGMKVWSIGVDISRLLNLRDCISCYAYVLHENRLQGLDFFE